MKTQKSSRKTWTPKEDKVLMDNYDKSYGWLMDELPDRSYNAISHRWHILLKSLPDHARAVMPKRPKTIWDKEIEDINSDPSLFSGYPMSWKHLGIKDELAKDAESTAPSISSTHPGKEAEDLKRNLRSIYSPIVIKKEFSLLWGLIKIKW